MTGELSHQSAPHRIVIEIDAYGMHTTLVCPDDGSCESSDRCSQCGRTIGDAEIKPCYDCPTEPTDCWLKSWADNVDLADEGYMIARVEFPIEATWDGDHPHVVQLVESEATDG